MVPALLYYNKHLKNYGRDWVFPLEEVSSRCFVKRGGGEQ
jgi:hypothetical protein